MTNSLAATMALEHITSAEEMFGLQRDPEAAKLHLSQAVALQKVFEHFHSRKIAHRDPISFTEGERETYRAFTQISTRAFALAWYMGDRILAETLYKRAYALASGAHCGDIEQGGIIVALWQRLSAPWWKRPFIALRNLFVAVGAYELRKDGIDL